MKVLKLSLMLIMLSYLNTFGQFSQFNQMFPLNPQEGFFGGGAGMTWIDDKPHVTAHFFPEFSFANFGIGIDLNLEFDEQGQVRTENFNEFSDYLSIIRYARYGYRYDPLYVRLGALDFASLGHGSIMHRYNNSLSYDTRKIGVEFNVDFNVFGIEGVYSSFGENSVVGARGYVRPLTMTRLSGVPILGGIEFGATYTTDLNEFSGVMSGVFDSTFTAIEDSGPIKIFGLDVSLPIIKGSFGIINLYYDYAEIVHYGSGRSTGIDLNLNGLGLIDVKAKFERRWNGPQYLPNYFNAFYELDRFKFDEETNLVTSKVQILESNISVGNGYYGELWISVLNSFDIIGSYQRLDDNPESGVMQLRTDISPENTSIVARAGYDKINIQDEKDLFTLDDRSYLYAEVGYKPIEYILMSVIYQWTFSPVRDVDDNVINYVPQKKIEPRVSFVYPIDL